VAALKLADAIAAGRDNVLFPRLPGRVDAVVGRDDPRAVIDGDAAQTGRIGAANHSADILGNQRVQLPDAEQILDLIQFRPIQPFALALSGDDSVLDRPLAVVRHDLLGVINLIF